MKRKILAGCVGVFALVFVACGDSSDANGVDKTEEISKDDGTPLVETFDELPNCTAKREGDSVYVEEEDLTFICQDGTWEEADEGEEDSPKSSDSNKNDDDEGSGDSDGDTDSNTDDDTASSDSGYEEDSGYATEEDLPNCTAKREGLEAYVKDADVTFVCRNEMWVNKAELPPSFATEEDLPVCSAKREGVKVWLEDAGALVVCASQKWIPVEESSASNGGSSGSQEGTSASSTPESSTSTESSAGNGGSSGSVEESSTSTVSSSSVAVTGRIAGTCSAPVNSFNGLGRNEATTWSFTPSTSGIGAKNFHWTFDEGASIASSTDPIPSVSYSTAGTHTTKLVVNKGLDSESKEITCSVKVTGTRVKNCGCTTTTTSPIRVTPTEPRTISWAVSGCTGAGPFTYSWSSGYAGTGATGTRSIGTEGTYAPTVTITNSEEMDTTITCGSVVAQEPPTAVCNLAVDSIHAASYSTASNYTAIPGQQFWFAPRSVQHVSGSMIMELDFAEDAQAILVNNGSYNKATKLTAPEGLGTYPVTLAYNGETVCSATLKVDYPKPNCNIGTETANSGSYTAIPGQSFYFRPGNSNFSGTINMNLNFNGSTRSIVVYPSGNSTSSLTAPEELGTYPVTLTYRGNQVCSATLMVERVTSTSCGITKTTWNTNTYFTPGASFENWDYVTVGSRLTMTLFQDDVKLVSKDVEKFYNSEQWYQITPPTEPGTYTYRLDYHGNTVCEVEYEVE